MHGLITAVFMIYLYVYRLDVEAAVCSFTDYPVLSMCQYGEVSGKGVYLDTSEYTGASETCTCTLQSIKAGGSVTFNPVVIDKSNCQTTISLEAFTYVHDCTSIGVANGFLPVNTAVNLTLQGVGEVKDCLKVSTEAAEMTLTITCHESRKIPTTTATTVSTVTEGGVCPSGELPVLSMCWAGTVEAQRLYIETSLFNNQYSSCTCTVQLVSQSDDTVQIFPHTTDSSNCNTIISVGVLSYFIGCGTTSQAARVMSPSDSFDLEITGTNPANHCVLVRTKTTASSIRVDCADGINQTDVTTSTTATTEIATPTATTEAPSPITGSCQSTQHPVLNMCTVQTVDAQRMYLESSLFTDQYSSCHCSVQVVSQAGGTVEIYPYHIDTSNCNTNITVDALSYHIGCNSFNANARRFLYTSDSLDFEIKGRGSAAFCVLVQIKGEEARLQMNCTEGIIRPETTTVTTTTKTTTTPAVTSTLTTTPTTTSIATTTTSQRTTTEEPTTPTTITTTTTVPTTSTVQTTPPPTTTTTSEATTTTAPTTTQPPTTTTTSTPQTTTVPPTSGATSTTITTTTNRTDDVSTVNIPDEKGPVGYRFPVIEVAVGVPLGLVALVVIAIVLSCYRRHQYEKKTTLKEQKQPMYGYPNHPTESDMLEVRNISVENPIYVDEDADSISGQAVQTAQQDFDAEDPSSDHGDDISAVYSTVNKQRKDPQVDLTYADVDKAQNGAAEVPHLPETEESVRGMIRL